MVLLQQGSKFHSTPTRLVTTNTFPKSRIQIPFGCRVDRRDARKVPQVLTKFGLETSHIASKCSQHYVTSSYVKCTSHLFDNIDSKALCQEPSLVLKERYTQPNYGKATHQCDAYVHTNVMYSHTIACCVTTHWSIAETSQYIGMISDTQSQR